MPAVALLSWPLIAAAIFFALGPGRGMIWTLLLGFLFLPEEYGFDLPALPAYEKYSVISLSLVLGILLTRNREEHPPELADPLVKYVISILIAVMFLGMAVTVFDNPDPIVRGGRFQRGHGIRELISFTSGTLILLVPFFLARRWLADPEIQREFLRAIVILAVAYSFLVLFERRMSPRLNRMVYGLQMDAWQQHIRGGGFRPMVFLNHGLVIGYFYLTAVLAAVGLSRGSEGQMRIVYGLAAAWLFLILALSRNAGALLLAVLFAPTLVFFSRRMLLWVVTTVALLFTFYPAAQQAHLIPNTQLVALFEKLSTERARSIQFRFDNEEGLLARALEKPIFGWGGWGRNRVVDDQGRDVSVPDGIWIIQLGQFGWIGYLSYFGLLTLPLLFLWRRKEIPFATMTLAMMTAANLIYLLPNSTLGVLAWMVAGTTVGFLQYGRKEEAASEASTDDTPREPPPSRSAYSRFPAGPARQTASYRRNLSR